MISGAIDFKYLLIDNYKKLRISENELATIFVIDHYISMGESFITADLLALKMSMDVKTIDSVLASLFAKGFIEFKTVGKNTITSIEPLKDRLYNAMEVDYNREKEEKKSKKVKDELDNIFTTYEVLLNRQLSPVEISKIKEWIAFGYTENQITDALKDALNKGKKTLRSVDKILLSYQIREDMENEGMSTIDNDWNHNLEETIKIAKTPWLKNDE